MRAIGVDWSGAARGEDRHLWVAEAEAETSGGCGTGCGTGTGSGTARIVSLAPATRERAVDRLIDAAGEAGGMVAGLDFSFSLPAWWLLANRITAVGELWADADRLEAWLATCRPPFWGRPGRARPRMAPDREYRLTERVAPRRPRSTFQLGGAGAVGTGSLRGMPHLARLRAAGLSIWPWDPWAPPVVAEVWPRLSLGATVKSSAAVRRSWAEAHRSALDDAAVACVAASADALDAVAAALDLARRAGCPRPPPVAEQAALEGWIDGVPERPSR